MDEALAKEIGKTLQQRLSGKQPICWTCGGTRWQSNGITKLTMQDDLNPAVIIGGRYLPMVDLTCQVCGSTQLYNIIVLLGREKFNEIVKQQQEDKQAVQEAENIVRQGGQKDGNTEKAD